ncbi:MAG: hypothetical protein A2275_12200 [Bacteroidetes bacterium RIFOXYA12_FULL_35_11]|nr:MAG: hypothetical protein A2X01_01415 [Bacteroidetes bacterium GWF2_35_48]OFY77736.1 MAG: hypothetical protein A2275_12200 [Bacteroidetes bacterium RIFOXYA12_FULL_35_11]OFY98412.1 MAG: hypothetical protein A2491_14605 [Bacteroidetes bacterium RIFOXYC12_FULL_35_7]HBX51916.1 hypothetical protein [Bacteroidales bacterium]
MFNIFAFGLCAQGLVIQPGANLVSNGPSLIIVDGNGGWINNGTASLVTGSTNTVKFVGNAAQNIGGANSTTFYNITVANSSTGLVLGKNINVNGTLYMGTGDFDLKSFNIDLGTTGSLNNESATSRIKVTPILTDGNDGKVIATRTLVSGLNSNIAGLRLDINSTSYTGVRTISRGHQQLAGTGDFSANVSALLYYLLPGIGQLSTNNRVIINYFDVEFQNNTVTEANIRLFQEIQQGGVPWFTRIASTVNAGSNLINSDAIACPYDTYVCDRLGLITFNELITIGSNYGDHPLPINLVSFTTVCDKNKVLLQWTTSSEINNDYFTLEKSPDLYFWQVIATISGAGNSSSQNNYIWTDEEPYNGIAYYRLKQTDYNGDFTYSAVVSTDCETKVTGADFYNLIIFNNPYEDDIVITFQGEEGLPYSIFLIDQLGRKLYNKISYVSDVYERISISKNSLSTGIYNIVLLNETNIHTKQIAIIRK